MAGFDAWPHPEKSLSRFFDPPSRGGWVQGARGVWYFVVIGGIDRNTEHGIRGSENSLIPVFRIPTSVLRRPGSDRLSRGFCRSTMGAGGFNGRVRNGIGWNSPARTTRSAKNRKRSTEYRDQNKRDLPIPVFRTLYSARNTTL